MLKLKRMPKFKKKGIGVITGLLCMGVVFGAVLSNVFAHTQYYLTDASVELDGVNDGTAVIELKSPIADEIFSIEGIFSAISVAEDPENPIYALTVLTPPAGITPSSNTVSDGRILWQDASWENPIVVQADGTLWTATYRVGKDTPAGQYLVFLSGARIASESENYDTANLGNLYGHITVTRNDTPVAKPNQVVTFRDGEGQEIGAEGVTKYYGDEDFTVTKEVTTGDGEIREYHPDDDGTGRIAHTAPDSDLVGVGEPGDVDICAWLDETENYAETKVCYTVHVMKRPLDIVGATIAPKTYDGTNTATVTNVSFEDKGLGNDEYNATATFDDVNANESVAVHVSVELTGGAEDHYILNASNFNTTAPIAPFHLIAENVSLPNGNTYTYDSDGVEPEVRVEANTHGGLSTLVDGEDYEVSYSNNTSVGTEAHVTVTGKGNYTTADVPVVLDFTIEKKGVNTGNLIAPNSVVEGHIITKDEIRMNVDGRDLVQCANAGDTNCDYTVEIQGENDGVVGHTVHIAVNACNNYDGVAATDIEIVAKLPQTVSFGDVTNTTVNKIYSDANFRYEATSDDGTITYSSTNESVATVDEETGEVTIVGVGDTDIIATAAETDEYAEGSAKYTVSVSKGVVTVSAASVSNKTYDGTTAATVNSVSLNGSKDSLVLNTDFTATAAFNNADAGNRIVTIDVTLSSDTFANYCFMVNSECVDTAAYITDGRIEAFTLGADNATAVLSDSGFEYNGEAKEPTASVSVDLDGNGAKETTLIAGTDYEISYGNNVNAGTATATITGKNNYTGSLPALEYTISSATVSDVTVTASSQTYTGSALEPILTVTGTVNGESVTFTTNDYTVAAHEDFINASDYTVTINSKEGSNYSVPTTSGTFTIDKAGSGEPAEFGGDLKIEAGRTLADLGERTEGFSWVDATTEVAIGDNSYPATYTKNGDTQNYETANLSIAVYGLKRIGVTTVETDGGTMTGPGASALEGDELVFDITPDDGYELRMLMANGEDRTGDVSNGRLTLTAPSDDLMVIVYFRRVYEVIRGDGQIHIIGVDGAAEFEIDADYYELFEDYGVVYVDGEELDAENYDAWSGSTVISLKADYLDALALGDHLLEVGFDDGGIARASFKVLELEDEDEDIVVADTGAFMGVSGGAVSTGVSVIAILGLAGVAFVVTKKSKKA